MITVRAYRPADREAVERVNYETGLVGASLAALEVSRRFIARGIAGYFENYPDYIFVAESGEAGVVGYVFGGPPVLDGGSEKVKVLRRIAGNLCRLPFVPPGDRRYIANQVRVTVKAGLGIAEEGRFKTPDNAAHLHINLLPGHRGHGTGRQLLEAFTGKLKQEGVKAVYAGSYLTARNPNRHFWTGNGFSEYSKIKSSVWEKVFPGETIQLVCYTKEIA